MEATLKLCLLCVNDGEVERARCRRLPRYQFQAFVIIIDGFESQTQSWFVKEFKPSTLAKEIMAKCDVNVGSGDANDHPSAFLAQKAAMLQATKFAHDLKCPRSCPFKRSIVIQVDDVRQFVVPPKAKTYYSAHWTVVIRCDKFRPSDIPLQR